MSGVSASADVFRAVADPTRRAMLDLLRQAESSVGELHSPFRMTKPAISQHLKILRKAGLVTATRARRRRIYRLNAFPLRGLLDWAMPFKRFTDPSGHFWDLRKAAESLRPVETSTSPSQPRKKTKKRRFQHGRQGS